MVVGLLRQSFQFVDPTRITLRVGEMPTFTCRLFFHIALYCPPKSVRLVDVRTNKLSINIQMGRPPALLPLLPDSLGCTEMLPAALLMANGLSTCRVTVGNYAKRGKWQVVDRSLWITILSTYSIPEKEFAFNATGRLYIIIAVPNTGICWRRWSAHPSLYIQQCASMFAELSVLNLSDSLSFCYTQFASWYDQYCT